MAFPEAEADPRPAGGGGLSALDFVAKRPETALRLMAFLALYPPLRGATQPDLLRLLTMVSAPFSS
jgi:hypothetical protein